MTHKSNYSIVSSEERLACLDMTPSGATYLRNNLRDRMERESSIPEDDIEATLRQIIEHPYLGGKKGSLKLVEDEQAFLGETFYREIKEIVGVQAQEEWFRRKCASIIEENQKQRQKEMENIFHKYKPKKAHEIWAMDYLRINLFGHTFVVCVVYELFSQAVLSMAVGETPHSQVAQKAINEAMAYTNTKPSKYLRTDNDRTFDCSEIEKLTKDNDIDHQLLPPGKPWFNGELESTNRDLRKAILTKAAYLACQEIEISHKKQPIKNVADFLQQSCEAVRDILNYEIPKKKFNTVPMNVLNGHAEKNKKKNEAFVEKKKLQRSERMAAIKDGKIKTKHKTIYDKTKDIWKKVSKELSDEVLFTFNELINGRYTFITR
jgi:transposase InsO family protein